MSRFFRALAVPAFVAYPFLVAGALFLGLEPKLLPLLLVFAAGVTAFGSGFRRLWIVGAGLAAALFFTDETVFLRLYPVLMNAAVACAFAASLFGRPLVEIFAEKMGHELDEAGRAYTRKATLAWAIFMGANTLVSLVTVFLPLSVWTIYNGGISYALIGLMAAGEFLVRRRARRCADA
ncbi:MAG: hypothetical protein ACI4P3_02855 [Candidatus Spyradosoma sp.]